MKFKDCMTELQFSKFLSLSFEIKIQSNILFVANQIQIHTHKLKGAYSFLNFA